MKRVGSPAEVLESIQAIKARTSGLITNFFPQQARLEEWIEHDELLTESREGALFFLRKDRDFWHCYFCAVDAGALTREACEISELKQSRVVADVVGNEKVISGIIGALEEAGFRRYSHLQRMARVNGLRAEAGPAGAGRIELAGAEDCRAVVELLDGSFDRFADQLPVVYEIEAALARRQILAVKTGGTLAAILFFETQGVSSTLRYWAVAEPFRNKRYGSALIRHYFEMHPAVRRFILWVVAKNHNAVEKYEHYGYKPDGLIDHVLANAMIPE